MKINYHLLIPFKLSLVLSDFEPEENIDKKVESILKIISGFETQRVFITEIGPNMHIIITFSKENYEENIKLREKIKSSGYNISEPLKW